MESNKGDEVISAILDRYDTDLFSREQVRNMLLEVWELAYQEGAYDFSDKVDRYPKLDPIQEWQAIDLASKLEEINKLCERKENGLKLVNMLFEDLEKWNDIQFNPSLSSMMAYWNDKLKSIGNE